MDYKKLKEESKEEIVKAYLDAEFEISELKKLKERCLSSLKCFCEHREGEIVVIRRKKKSIKGDWFYGYSEEEKEYEKRAVLSLVEPKVYCDGGVEYSYTFSPLKKDGGISLNTVYAGGSEIEWTGEIHESYMEKGK